MFVNANCWAPPRASNLKSGMGLLVGFLKVSQVLVLLVVQSPLKNSCLPIPEGSPLGAKAAEAQRGFVVLLVSPY